MESTTLQEIHRLFHSLPSPHDDRSLLTADVDVIKNFPNLSLVLDRKTRLAFLFFHRKDKAVNILDIDVLKKCAKIFDVAERMVQDGKIRAVIVMSLKNQNFIAGADINMIFKIQREEQAIHGSCLGGGLEVALACSHRICTNHKYTQLGLPEVKLGLLPGCGGTVRLPRLIGLQEALEMMLQGVSINARQAQRRGLVDGIFDMQSSDAAEKSQFFAHVVQYAMDIPMSITFDNESKYNRRGFDWKDALLQSNFVGRFIIERMTHNMLDKTTKKKYPAPYVILDSAMRSFSSNNLQDACDIEAQSFGILTMTPEAKNLMWLFQRMEAAKKLENYCQENRAIDLRKLAVIGSGVMLSSIAQFCAYKGYEMYMTDVKHPSDQTSLRAVDELFQNLLKRGKINESEKQHLMNRVVAVDNLDTIEETGLVIEAFDEETLSVRHKILADAERMNPNAIFATNSSSTSIMPLVEQANRKEDVIGMHFFYPVHRTPLVEITVTSHTSRTAVATVYKMVLQLGKIPVIVNDDHCTFTTRLRVCLAMEATRIILSGYPIERLDELLVRDWLSLGAFHMMDESGIDLIAHNVPNFDSDSLVLDFFLDMVSKGAIGIRSGNGFYAYDEHNNETGINPKAMRLIHRHKTGDSINSTDKDAIDRCILLMMNELSRCVETGLVNDPEDADMAMVLGFGFAPFTGGPLHLADSIGLPVICARLDELTELYGRRFRPTTQLRTMAQSGRRYFPKHIYPPESCRVDVDNLRNGQSKL